MLASERTTVPVMNTLALALVGLESVGEGSPAEVLREQLQLAREIGASGVVLNAAAAGLRPRELDRSARRDLVATFRRHGLELCGVDLLVPPEHFTSTANQDRAVSATLAAIELASEIGGSGGRVVGVTLAEKLAPDIAASIEQQAAHHGVRVADLSWRAGVAARGASLGVAIDPAAVIMGGGEPGAESFRLGAGVVMRRLSDASSAGRVAAGSGRLDLMAYAAACAVAGQVRVVLDVRGVREPRLAAVAGAKAWGAALAGK